MPWALFRQFLDIFRQLFIPKFGHTDPVAFVPNKRNFL